MSKNPNSAAANAYIELCNEMIAANGSLYSHVLALGEMFSSDLKDLPFADRESYDELLKLYYAANTILYRQRCALTTWRSITSFEELADKHIQELRDQWAARKAKSNTKEEA